MKKQSAVRACLSIFKIKTAEGFQYRTAGLAGATIGIFWALIEIIVFTVFYTYADNKSAGFTAGLSLQQVISYVWLGQFLCMMRPMQIDQELHAKITSGDVAVELCRPLDLYAHWFSKTAATRLTPLFWRGSLLLIAGGLMPHSYRLSPPASGLGFLCMLASSISALFLCTAFAMFVCAIRLQVNWGEGPTYIIMLVGGLLSGNYLPLQLWPQFLQKFLLLQPFAGYQDIPIRFYVGTLLPQNGAWVIGLQLVWVLFFILAGRTIMAKRLKNIVVQGG